MVDAVDSGTSATVHAVGRAADAVGSGVRSAVHSVEDGVSATAGSVEAVLRRCLGWKKKTTPQDAADHGSDRAAGGDTAERR